MWFKSYYKSHKCVKYGLSIVGVILIIIFCYIVCLHWRKYRRPTSRDYTDLKELNIVESYPGGGMYLKIDLKNKIIVYQGLSSEAITRMLTESDKAELIWLLQEYKFLEWPDGSYYMQNFKGTYARRTGIPFTESEYYMGLEEGGSGQSGYDCTIWYLDKHMKSMSPAKSLNYNNYGFPEGYNEFMDYLWEFVFRHDIEHGGIQLDLAKRTVTPDMRQQNAGILDYDNISCFSINEFFGGAEGGPGASLSYIRRADKGTIEHRIWTIMGMDKSAINFVDKDGKLQKYRERNNWWENKWRKQPIVYGSSVPFSEEGKKELIGILKKYDLASWHGGEYYQNQTQPNYILAGNFFNLDPNKQYKDITELEHYARSSYESFIYLYDTNGVRFIFRYDNKGLPENYNEFRKEIWDFESKYMYENDTHYEDNGDWRELLDQWGNYYLELLREREEWKD